MSLLTGLENAEVVIYYTPVVIFQIYFKLIFLTQPFSLNMTFLTFPTGTRRQSLSSPVKYSIELMDAQFVNNPGII